MTESRLYRLKTLERVLYTLFIILALCCYKSRDLMNYLFVDNGFIFLPFGVILVGSTRMGSAYYLDQYTRSRKVLKEIKSNEKEEKRSLINKLDPVVVETLREIVMSDMKKEMEEMRNSDQGCS